MADKKKTAAKKNTAAGEKQSITDINIEQSPLFIKAAAGEELTPEEQKQIADIFQNSNPEEIGNALKNSEYNDAELKNILSNVNDLALFHNATTALKDVITNATADIPLNDIGAGLIAAVGKINNAAENIALTLPHIPEDFLEHSRHLAEEMQKHFEAVKELPAEIESNPELKGQLYPYILYTIKTSTTPGRFGGFTLEQLENEYQSNEQAAYMYGLVTNQSSLLQEYAHNEALPFLQEVLKDKKYTGRTLEELERESADNEKTLDLFISAINEAIEAEGKGGAELAEMAATVNNETTPAKGKDLPITAIYPAKAKEIPYPIDKINNNVFNLFVNADKNGQYTFAMEKKGAKAANVVYSICFDEIEKDLNITKKLTPIDKRLYIAVSALFNAGNDIVSLSQIYSVMGNGTNRPSSKQLQKLRDSLNKMAFAKIHLDNIHEAKAQKNRKKFEYDGYLLPVEWITEKTTINNKITEVAVHIFREPPLITFARERDQITTIEPKLLESPINQTNTTLAIEDYLIERIAQMKNPKRKSTNKILYASMFNTCGQETKLQKKRAKETAKRFLDHYKTTKWIIDYKDVGDGITIRY